MKKTITVIIDKRNNEQYLSAEDCFMVNSKGKQTPAYTLRKQGGEEVTVSKHTYKKWFVEQEVEVEDPKPEPKKSKAKTSKPDESQSQKERKNVKGDLTSIGEDEVLMRAFTGMVIGVFKVIDENDKAIAVTTKKGKMWFSKRDGKQVNAKNKKFANQIERAATK